jgi:glycosyltransferase involved in cell wall biosynthesis
LTHSNPRAILLQLQEIPPTSANKLTKVSLMLPAFNESGDIARTVRQLYLSLENSPYEIEIIIVDDGSTDGTRAVAEKLNLPKLKVVGYNTNRGKGNALRQGLEIVTGEFTVFVDSDSDIDSSNLVEYIDALRNADVAVASKRHKFSSVSQPMARKVMSIGFNAIARLLTGVTVSDTQCGLKAFRTPSLKKIMRLMLVKKYAFDVELLAIAALYDMRVTELPVKLNLQAQFPARHILRMTIDVLGIWYRLRLRKWYQRNLLSTAPSYRPVLRL